MVANSFPETDGDLGSIHGEEVITELTHDVVAGGLSIQNLHERWPVLCSARSASVRLLTELTKNSGTCQTYGAPGIVRDRAVTVWDSN